MMGEAEQHESKSQFASSPHRKFPVVKINKCVQCGCGLGAVCARATVCLHLSSCFRCRSRAGSALCEHRYGRKQNRIISIDPITGNLMNYDRHTRLHRRLPLEQLVQVRRLAAPQPSFTFAPACSPLAASSLRPRTDRPRQD